MGARLETLETAANSSLRGPKEKIFNSSSVTLGRSCNELQPDSVSDQSSVSELNRVFQAGLQRQVRPHLFTKLSILKLLPQLCGTWSIQGLSSKGI